MKKHQRVAGQLQALVQQPPVWQKNYDVIVVGGGCSGVYCALSAAKEGKRTLLIEKTAWCGGMHLQGLVKGYYYGCRGGLYEAADRESKQIAEDVFFSITEAKLLVLGRELSESGVDVMLNSRVSGIFADGSCVQGIEVAGEGISTLISCRMLVDATSNGYVMRLLPVAMHYGRETDESTQPYSSVRCVYLDQTKYDGGWQVPVGAISGQHSVYHEYRDSGYADPYDDIALTEAIVCAHARHLDHLPDGTRFLYYGQQIGLREGALFEGEQSLSLENVLTQKNLPDNILLHCFSDVDKHGFDFAFDEKTYQDWYVACNLSTCTVYIPLPVGSFVPKGWKGLLGCGRCLSMDSYVNSATRMNCDSFRIGEACGVLAAQAADCGQDPMAIPVEGLKSKLDGRGFFEKNPDIRPSFWTPARGNDRKFIQWMTDIDEIKKALATDCPGVALWSCRLLGKQKIGDQVFGLTKSEDEMLRFNAAIALGIMADERGLPLLHEIIRHRRAFYFMDCRRSNQMRSAIAIMLCGRLGDAGIKDELLSILQPEEFEKPMYHERLEPNYRLSIVKEQNAVYYQHFSHAVAALVRIALAHPEFKAEITAALHQALDDGRYIRRITSAPEWSAFYVQAKRCSDYFYRHLINDD